MTTNSYSLSRNSVIRRALRLCGVTAQGDEPDAPQIAEAVDALEAFLKALYAECNFALGITTKSITTVANQTTYSLDVDTLDVFYGIVRDSDGVDTQIRILPVRMFDTEIQNKTNQGVPNLAYVELTSSPQVTIFPAPIDATSTLIFRILKKAPNTLGSSSAMPVPENWYDVVRLADEYQLSAEKSARLKAQYNEFKAIAMRKPKNPLDTLMVYPV